ncbi:MAG: diacylglycerol kinase family lipid kinase [Verrucomicrobia bacterium]|nr:MAG: diacylglycerol kinase family lipid kinase [Verrucomicrobiota bacterium]
MPLPPRYPLIFNPKARSQRAQRAVRFIMDRATRFALYATSSSEEACDLAAKFAAAGEPVVVAAGGDGTLNAVVQGLAGTDTALGVIPTGTMNVFARELGIPNGHLDLAFQVIEQGFIREIDLFAVNDSPFMQMAGLGFDASVIEETTWESKKMLGPLAYLLAAVKVLGEKPPMMRLTTQDGREVSGVAVLAGNGTLYGGQFPLFRKADNQDEMLDVLVFQESGYRLVLDSLTNLVRGGVDLSDSVVHLQASHFTVRCESDFPIQVDGELWGRGDCAQFLPMERRLRVLAPEHPMVSRFSEAMKSWWGWTRKWQGIS